LTIYQYNFPTRIQFGAGSIGLMPDALKGAGKNRPLVVTDRGLAPLRPVTDSLARLRDSGLNAAVFSGIWGNPVASQVRAGVEAFRSHDADSIVGIGGGAALDVAKAIALMAHHPGDIFDYEDGKPDALPIDGPIPWWCSVPTTAGTGSEVGRSAVVSDDVTHVKKIVFSPRLLAAQVFADPELTVELPPQVTAATGMDALTHLVEAYLALGYQPLCDGIALQGVRMVQQSLIKAVEFARRIAAGETQLLTDPEHVRVRGLMLNAALMGGVAFQKGLGVTHSLAHALSTVCDMHHGLANGICITAAMRFNQEVAESRLADLAQMVGVTPATGEGFVSWLEGLKRATGIPSNLAAAGVGRDKLQALCAVALVDGCHTSNPRPVASADIEQLFSSLL
jgi:alcohol dehydrogenase class IV